MFEETLFPNKPSGESTQMTIGANDPVARNDDGNRVPSKSVADGSIGIHSVELLGKPLIRSRFSVGDASGHIPDLPLKIGRVGQLLAMR